jgi:hypothetical protein
MTAAFIGEVMSFEPQNRSFLEFDLFPSFNQPIDGQNVLRKNFDFISIACIDTKAFVG